MVAEGATIPRQKFPSIYSRTKFVPAGPLPQSPRRRSDYRQSVVAMPLDDLVHGVVELDPTVGKFSPKRHPRLAIEYHLDW
jgi:hypothetical protein